jgi:GTP-binding protein HflX
VGFIRNLPKDLFAAFRATFEEAADADLLLHVVDASDAASDDHVRTVLDVLEELDLSHLPRLDVYSKVDLATPAQLRRLGRAHADAVFVSGMDRETMRPLFAQMARELAEKWRLSARGPDVEPVSGETQLP